MGIYRKVLVAVDLSADSVQIAERARALATIHGATIELLHVVEPLPLVTPLDTPEALAPTVLQTQNELVSGARKRLQELAAEVGLGSSNVDVIIGNTQAEIVRAAGERHADLIVLGSRERHGLSLLVDFTEDSVLHKAPCDVLAVRVRVPDSGRKR
jgi:universal stress protein A